MKVTDKPPQYQGPGHESTLIQLWNTTDHCHICDGQHLSICQTATINANQKDWKYLGWCLNCTAYNSVTNVKGYFAVIGWASLCTVAVSLRDMFVCAAVKVSECGLFFRDRSNSHSPQRDGFLSLFILLGHMLKLIATNFSFFGETLDSSPNLPAEIIQLDPFRESDL